MNISDATPQRRQIAIERFVRGEDSLVFHDVVFYQDYEGFLVVESFSDFTTPENSSPSEAQEKIAHSKKVMATLSESSEDFRKLAEHLPHKYVFCLDYGKSAILLAKLQGGEVVWCAR